MTQLPESAFRRDSLKILDDLGLHFDAPHYNRELHQNLEIRAGEIMYDDKFQYLIEVKSGTTDVAKFVVDKEGYVLTEYIDPEHPEARYNSPDFVAQGRSMNLPVGKAISREFMEY